MNWRMRLRIWWAQLTGKYNPELVHQIRGVGKYPMPLRDEMADIPPGTFEAIQMQFNGDRATLPRWTATVTQTCDDADLHPDDAEEWGRLGKEGKAEVIDLGLCEDLEDAVDEFHWHYAVSAPENYFIEIVPEEHT